MTQVLLEVCTSFISIVKNFLGNHKAKNYSEIVDETLQHFEKLGTSMSIQLHYLHSRLIQFSSYLGDYSEKQEEE